MRELADEYLRRRTVEFSLPGKAFHACRAGADLVEGPVAGTITFARFLAS